jgi:tRNA threonylcarbamoyladenosine modification (KEOPS) complex  Pcc1 subunit
MTESGPWRAVIAVERSADGAERLARTLSPEASREVPRARCEIVRTRPGHLELRIEARDTGALRAALNTYLGWISLTDRTETIGHSVG